MDWFDFVVGTPNKVCVSRKACKVSNSYYSNNGSLTLYKMSSGEQGKKHFCSKKCAKEYYTQKEERLK